MEGLPDLERGGSHETRSPGRDRSAEPEARNSKGRAAAADDTGGAGVFHAQPDADVGAATPSGIQSFKAGQGISETWPERRANQRVAAHGGD